MASDALALAYQPTCEDYDSDQSSARVLESFRPSPSSHSNVAAKRAQPADVGGEKAPAVQQQQRVPVNIDLQSDSGYSSHTAATMSSADSAPSFSAMRSPPVAMPPVVAAPFPSQSPAQRNRRPPMGDPRQSSSQSIPRPKVLARRDSQTAKRPSAQRRPTITQARNESRDDEDCTDPNCTTCGPNAVVQRRRAEPPPSDSALDVSYPYDPRSQRSDTASPYASPPSPTYARQPQYAQGAAIAQPGQTRRRSSSTARTRPPPHSGDGPGYWVQGMPAPYPSPPQEHGPPPSASAYRNMQQYPQMASFMAPPQPNGFYTPASSIHQTSPPYESQRPALSARTSSSYSRTSYPPPVVTQDRSDRPMYSARYSQPLPSASLSKFTSQLDEGSSESESESEPEYLPDPRDVRPLLAPPKITSSSKQRPSMRKAKTTQVVDRIDRGERLERPARPDRRMSQSINNNPERSSPRDRERERDRDRDRPSRPSATLTRGPSVHRPALVQQRQTQSAYDTPHARVIVENPKSNRRQSYQGHDKVQEQYARAQETQYNSKKLNNRPSKIYRDERREPVEYTIEQKRRNRTSKVYQDDRYEPEEDKTEQKRRNRVSRVIQQERYETDGSDAEGQVEELALVPLSNRRRRETDADARRGKERTTEPKNKTTETAAEEYMKATRGGQSPYTDQVHKAAKRASRAPSARPSDSGSSQSKGSDKESQSNRTAITSGGPNDVIRLRVDASAPLSLSFNGDMEGRTLQFTPAENGMADIVIGGARGNESTYQSEKGTIMSSSRKNLIANQAWDPEDGSERSSRSGRSRREGRESREIRDDREEPRRILARRRDTHYH